MLSTEAIAVIDMPRADRAVAVFSSDPVAKMRDLSAWHDDLDLAIGALVESGHYDDLALARLKKRKLQIRDEMAGVAAHAPVELFADGGELAAEDETGSPPAQVARTGPGTASGLFMILGAMAGFWILLELMTDSASEIYTGLLILALLGNG